MIADVLSGAIRWHVEQGDCLDVLRSMPDASADMVLADLPYGTTRNKWDSCVDLSRLWPEIERIAKPAAALLFFAQTPFDKVLGASRLPLLRYEWIWEKGRATGFLNAKRMPMKAHENVLVFYRELPTYRPQRGAAAVVTDGHPRFTGTNSTNYNHAASRPIPWIEDGTRAPRTVLRFPCIAGQNTTHPTEKPVDLLRYFIRTYTDAGAVVLDPTCGFASTGAACAIEGRRFVGIEKDPEWAVKSIARLSLPPVVSTRPRRAKKARESQSSLFGAAA